MELSKPGEFLRDTTGMILSAGRFALKQVQGGAWGELGAKYGEEMGGLKQRPASLTFYRTPEVPEIPGNIQVGSE